MELKRRCYPESRHWQFAFCLRSNQHGAQSKLLIEWDNRFSVAVMYLTRT